MTYRAGRGWGMPFIVGTNYVPQDPEWEKHYKPEQQGCGECNGVKVPPPPPASPREILTCNGIKVIQSNKRPNVPPVSNREMDKQYVASTSTLKHTRIIGNNTRNSTNTETIEIDSGDVL